MAWTKRTIRGVIYSFEHLQPFVLKVPHITAGAPPYRVRVEYGCHVFSQSPSDDDPPDLHVPDGKRRRCFCPIRHGQSRFIRGFLLHAADKSVWVSHSGNHCLLASLPGLHDPYAIYFDVRKSGTRRLDAHLMVRSAYEKPEPSRMADVGFSELIASVAE